MAAGSTRAQPLFQVKRAAAAVGGGAYVGPLVLLLDCLHDEEHLIIVDRGRKRRVDQHSVRGHPEVADAPDMWTHGSG